MQGRVDPALTEDVYLTRTEFGFLCTNGEERLDRVIGKRGDLGVDAVTSELHSMSDVVTLL